MDTYTRICQQEGVTHFHCPGECEHPQPFVKDGILYCGKHWHDDQVLMPMIPCTPEVCD